VLRLHGTDRRNADARAPGQEFIGGAGIGPACVRVRMLAAKNSRYRMPTPSPAASAGTRGGAMTRTSKLMVARLADAHARSRTRRASFLRSIPTPYTVGFNVKISTGDFRTGRLLFLFQL
jgi:hypothetical protein